MANGESVRLVSVKEIAEKISTPGALVIEEARLAFRA
jgi:hypothetical protein